ncbi:hypothetical protein B296_00034245 [Ensete ventricosum]|uniref:Uncharacterized protein n=1 Tax=Ensete ventricosum TaxID=4639 RepID=A0A426XE61_ENSVE|nr:hypothetical protein B296_00034245 [Ensete ventricosum]
MNLKGIKQALEGQALRPEPSPSQTDPAIEASATYEPEPPAKKTKVLVSKEHPAPVRRAPSQSICDLCCIRAQTRDEPFLAQYIADLPEPSREGPLEAQWAMLTPQSQVWADEAEAQLFYWGLLYPPLAKEVYTTPSEVVCANMSILQHHCFSMGLIDRVCDSGRVADELSKIIDGLLAKVRKLKEVVGPMAMVRSSLQKAESSIIVEQCATPERARATITQYKETLIFKFGLEKMGRISYKYGYQVALACFWARYPQLEIEEDPYATLPMEVEVPFDDSLILQWLRGVLGVPSAPLPPSHFVIDLVGFDVNVCTSPSENVLYLFMEALFL